MSKTVAFSGYRPEKLPENIDPIQISLKSAVEDCINDGYDTFLCGMADGFDTMAAQAVIDLREKYNIKLICVIPYDDGRKHNDRYNKIIKYADDKIVLADKFSYDSYYVRNEYMVDNCDKLICYYDGRYGGTEYTVDYANKKGVEVFNIWDTITPELRMPKQIDNKRERVVDELKDALRKGSSLSVISAYFTIYAYAELKKELSRIDNMRFLFKEPTFVKKDEELLRQYYLDHKGESDISGNEFEIRLRNEMKQGSIAKECAKWISEKVEMKSFKKPNAAQPRMIHVENEKDAVMINGTVDFTTDGLGITPSNRVDSNMCIYGKEMTANFLKQFNEIWTDDTTVEDVKAQVLEQMKILYKENPPEFIYFIKSKKKDIEKIKKDIAKISTQKDKLLDLILNTDNEDLVKTYKQKLEEIIAQLSMNNDNLKLYESIDISEEEREIRKQFNKSHEDITYKDFQELSREQLKVFFNYMIDHIDIRELDITDDPKVYLAITIHLKLNGYAPKYSIEYLRKINTGEKQKASHSKNDLLNGGGEGGI